MEHLAQKLVRELGHYHRFDAICGSDTFPMRKPDPQHVIRTVELAGGNPELAIMVGDTRTDIDAARAAAVPVIAVDFGYTDTPVAKLGPDRVISHFDELWDAVHSFDHLPTAGMISVTANR